MRIAGAQIPVRKEVEKNFAEICKAIDYASENKCEFLVTPEAALSGYEPARWNLNTCKETEEALPKLVDYAVKKNVGLVLGTLWLEEKDNPAYGFTGGLVRNQQRFYDKTGNLLGVYNKVYTADYDTDMTGPGEDNQPIELLDGDEKIKVMGMICNDMWGSYYEGKKHLARRAKEKYDVDVILQSSNTGKDGTDDTGKIFFDFHYQCLKFSEFAVVVPILNVDSVNHIDGREYNHTGSPSGVFAGDEYLVPPTGTQYFYHEFGGRRI